MDERIAALNWVQMVDRVYGKIDQFHDELAITANDWRWAQAMHPAFFGRIRALEDEANPSLLEKAAFWDKLDRWGQNHLYLFRQIKRQREASSGIPEVTEDDVNRAVAAYRTSGEDGERRGGADSGTSATGKRPRAKRAAAKRPVKGSAAG